MEKNIESLKKLIDLNDVEKALELSDELLAMEEADKEKIYYLRGNIYRKMSNWQQALNNYQYSMDINPDGPAAYARKSVIEILDYYYKDQFNQ